MRILNTFSLHCLSSKCKIRRKWLASLLVTALEKNSSQKFYLHFWKIFKSLKVDNSLCSFHFTQISNIRNWDLYFSNTVATALLVEFQWCGSSVQTHVWVEQHHSLPSLIRFKKWCQASENFFAYFHMKRDWLSCCFLYSAPCIGGSHLLIVIHNNDCLQNITLLIPDCTI